MQAQHKLVWTVDDWANDLCQKHQIGKPKPDVDLVQEELSALSDAPGALSPADLRQDVLKAYKELGGAKFLMQNPALLQKLLVKMVGETKETNPATVAVNISWLTPDRLSYRQAAEVVDIAPAIAGDRLIEQSAKPDAPQGWKAPPPEAGLAAILRHPDRP